MLVVLARFLTRVLPATAAARVIRGVAARTQRSAILAPHRAALDRAAMLRYGKGDRNIAWGWGKGPLVLFVHGWNGRAAQMAPLAAAIADLGFRCVALDVTGHGDSQGRCTSWRHFIEDISDLTTVMNQEVHAYVGHSAGGLAMMAAREIKGIRASRYVCICAPSYPFPPIRAIRERLAPAPILLSGYQDFVAGQFDTTWSQLDSGKAFRQAGSDLLLFYDESDRYVAHTEGDRIQAWCPGARLVKSSGYGHSRVLSTPELTRELGAFLNQ